MKTLEQLDVPPAPWTVQYKSHEGMVQYADLVIDATGNCVATVIPYDNHPSPSTRLMAAAPKLYEALREAVVHECYSCEWNAADFSKCGYGGKCAAKKWRKALKKAGGAK